MKNGVGETLDPSIPVRQKAVHAMWECARLEILCVDRVGKTVRPIGEEDRHSITLSLKEIA